MREDQRDSDDTDRNKTHPTGDTEPDQRRRRVAGKLRSLDCVTVKISPLAFTRALRNLVINAATHGGGARVGVTAETETALVTIEDDGPGIPEKDLSSVFESFFRADPARRKHIPGVGLGLAIAKEIIERQAGALAIENRKPRGLRQTLSFERQVALSPADASPTKVYS
jgi:signal transduction histidine kinase